MITKVRLKNFKKIEDQEFSLSDFDLLVGTNNSGKSTLLQALAIWQYCIDQFKRPKRSGSTGIQIVLPEFTALPLPEFNLLWKDKIERRSIKQNGKNKPEFILIEIEVFWKPDVDAIDELKSVCVQLRYQSPLSIYAIPKGGFQYLREMIEATNFPNIVYVPPFSGLEPTEKWQDDGNVRQNVGKGQPGSVLRNLLFRVIDRINEDGRQLDVKDNQNWQTIHNKIFEWFGVDLTPPKYEKGQSTQIEVNFKVNRREFDIISGGSGFHQILTLMAFFYGYNGVSTILFDEPDAHLHVNLQRKILSYFKQLKNIQFIIATHSEEFIRSVEMASIISLLSGEPKRIVSTNDVIKAMSDVDNIDVVKTSQSPYVLYVEGEDDERLLNAWATVLEKTEVIGKFHIVKLGGADKREMSIKSDEHFKALKQINTNIKRIVLFDYDDENSFHPGNNPVIKEWKRRNIENYLLVPSAWERAVLDALNAPAFDLLTSVYRDVINAFFSEQGLSLPIHFTWRDVKANIFQVINGKQILFESEDALFHRIRNVDNLIVNRDKVARNMEKEEVHQDILSFFETLEQLAAAE